MTIQRIATTPAELTVLGGTFNTTDTTKFDPKRVRGIFEHIELQISSLNFPAVAGDTTWIHFDHTVKRNNGNANFWSNSIMEFHDANNNRLAYIEIVPTMNWTVNVDNGTSTAIATQQVLSENSGAISMDFKIVVGATIDLEVYFNGGLQGTASLTNANSYGNPTKISFGIYDNSTGTYSGGGKAWFGSFIIADEDTRGFQLRELHPQSFGVFQQWDGTADSVFDDSLATGISTDVADERASFGLANTNEIGPSDLINRVVVQTYAQRGASGLTSINHFFRYDDGTVVDGADIALGTVGDWYIDDYAQNPRTSAPWDPADLAGIQLGVRSRV